MKRIKLTQDKHALVDDGDFEYLNKWKWQFDSKTGYANKKLWIKDGKGKELKIYLHRLIMKNPSGKRIDHINRNKLDCRKENLRIATHSQNLMNRNKNSNNTTGYKGVFFDKTRNKWKAEIKHFYKTHYLGRFDTPKEAAFAYNEGARKYHGEFAYLNQLKGGY